MLQSTHKAVFVRWCG